MFRTQMPTSTAANGIGITIDGSGTIDPAALNASGSAFPSSNLHAQEPRGQKRSRSPDDDEDGLSGGGIGGDDDDKRKKRGRPPKSKLGDEDPSAPVQQVSGNSPEQLRTPVSQPSILPQDTQTSPTQTSPPKPAPAKGVLKALPTVRDHTTDVLTPEGDEYIPREFDEAGERKVSPQGIALEGREFKIRTFYVPNRGDKMFMLATECARVLNYRDSYLLFNKNRSLYKIIATQAEKDELIHQEILPYSYRSRQIAIVTAKSMFRQFGARVIVDGRRVKDDYWEAKARKQGFTEDDMAGEKRPGGGKAREALEAAQINPEVLTGPNILYAPLPFSEPPPPLHQMPLPPGSQTRMMNRIDFSGVPPRKQDMTGAPYIDHTQRSTQVDLIHQAQNAVENNKLISQQREQRGKIYHDSWNRVHESPVREKIEQPSPTVSQGPPIPSNNSMSAPQKPMVVNQNPHMMSPQVYNRGVSSSSSGAGSVGGHGGNAAGHSNVSHSGVTHAQSPARQQPMPAIPANLQHTPQNRSVYNPSHHAPQTSPYGYHPQPGSMWGQPPPQPQQHSSTQQSPISPNHPSVPHYSPSPHQSQPQLPPHHALQSPHGGAAPPPQLHHTQTSTSMHGNLNYQTMGGMTRAGSVGPYGGMGGAGRSMYNPAQGSPRSSQPQQQQQQPPQPQHQQPHHQQQQQQQPQQQPNYINHITAAQQAPMHGYPSPATQHPGQGGWGGYPVSSGY